MRIKERDAETGKLQQEFTPIDDKPSDAERIAQLEADKAALQEDNLNLMLAVTEVYELMLAMGGGS